MQRPKLTVLLTLLLVLATLFTVVEPVAAALERNHMVGRVGARTPLAQAQSNIGSAHTTTSHTSHTSHISNNSTPTDIEPAARVTVSAHLQAQLAEDDGPLSFLAIFKEQSEPEHVLAQSIEGQSRGAAFYAYLTAKANHSQAELRAWLDSQGIPYRPFYIVNMVEVYGDKEVVEALRSHPELDRLVANPVVNSGQMLAMPDGRDAVQSGTLASYLSTVNSPYQNPTGPGLSNEPTVVATPYGVSFTNAPKVWDMGYRGQGVVVAGQDTGVDWDHPALLESYRGWNESGGSATHAYNWFDAWDIDSPSDPCAGDTQAPCDDDGHGTHTLGTIVGFDGGRNLAVGLAPDAEWIGCRNMLFGFGTPSSYAACFEFFLAPFPQGGDPFTDGRPELAPHVISNSWGCPPYEGCDADSLRQAVETVRAAGQFVVSSAGNYGLAGCGTVRDPIAIYDAAFSVGAHDARGVIASFSSRGPVTVDNSNRLKPDITAPGVNVLSAYPAERIRNSDDPYFALSGTSMAAPHMAGTVALLWSAAPHLIGAIDETEQILLKSATRVVDNHCGEDSDGASPNHTYGYGRVNALAAVEMALTPWSGVVEVSNDQGAPISGVQVDLVDARTGFLYAAQTGFNGLARLPRVYHGTYELQINIEDATIEDATIIVDELQLDSTSYETGQAYAVNGLAVRYQMERPQVDLPGFTYFLPIVGQ